MGRELAIFKAYSYPDWMVRMKTVAVKACISAKLLAVVPVPGQMRRGSGVVC